MIPLLPVISFLKSPLFKYLLVVLVVIGIIFGIYRAGENHIQDEWDAEKERTRKEIEELTTKANAVTTKIETVYVDRIKTIVTKGNVITQYVDRFITAESDAKCIIPNNFVLLHDSAATNSIPGEPGAEAK